MKADKADLFDSYWRMLVKSYDHPPEREYRFHPIRRWRFDFAWPDQLIAVEVDGNAWHTKGGGRHGTDKDREKINAAASRSTFVGRKWIIASSVEPRSTGRLGIAGLK